MRASPIVCFVCLGLLLPALTVAAKDKSAKRKKAETEFASTRGASGQTEPALQVKWGFSDQERQVMREYVQGYTAREGKGAKHLPPGLAKKVARGGRLPPGWQSKCVPGEILAPEVYDQCHALPPEMVVKLPPPPEPTLTVTIGGKVVRLLKATREILDVFDVNVPF